MTIEEKQNIYNLHKENSEKIEQERIFQQHNFDNWLIKICSGVFGVSFAFIEKIIDFSVSVCKFYLITAWACFAFCLVFEVFGYMNSEKVCRNAYFDEWIKYQNETENANIEIKKTFGAFLSKVLNKINFLLFLFGSICLILFIAINI